MGVWISNSTLSAERIPFIAISLDSNPGERRLSICRRFALEIAQLSLGDSTFDAVSQKLLIPILLLTAILLIFNIVDYLAEAAISGNIYMLTVFSQFFHASPP